MINTLKILLAIIFLVTAFPVGIILRRKTKEEVLATRKWLKFVNLMLFAVIFIIINLLFLDIIELKLLLSVLLAVIYFSIIVYMSIK